MSWHSAIYSGDVVHQRKRPKQHRLHYRVFSLLLDIDELDDLDKNLGLFAHNRWAPVAFHDRDHGPANGEALRPWVEAHLRQANIAADGGAIKLLCYPRLFGYAFNPLSSYFCYGRDGRLNAIIYEVCNTFKERHSYIIPVMGNDHVVIRQNCAKALYVSPFISMDTHYHFRIIPPGETVNIVIRQEDADGLLLAASFRGERQSLTATHLMRHLARFPFLTLKIIAAIHWEALQLWLKGLRVIPHVAAEHPISASVERHQTRI